MRRIVLVGGSGFLGKSFVKDLSGDAWEPVILTRRLRQDEPGVRESLWDGRTVGQWADELDGALAVVNYAGRSIHCRFNALNRAAILNSRIDSVRAIGAAAGQCASPPKVWIQASAAGIYGNAGDSICDEFAPHGQDFLATVCKTWEQTFDEEAATAVRKVVLRIGPVLGTGGGALEKLAGLARWGLGGTAGNGRQWISWIHIADLNRLVSWAIDDPSASGVYNAVAPHPSRNRDFMRALRRALGVRVGPPAPALALRMGSVFMGFDPSLALTGQRCVPTRLLEAGFAFRHSDLAGALESLV